MKPINTLVVFSIFIFSACSPMSMINSNSQKLTCSNDINGPFLTAELYPENIILKTKNEQILNYNTIEQSISCENIKTQKRLFKFSAKEAEAIAKGIKDAQTQQTKMIIRNYSSDDIGLSAFAENKCKQVNFTFIFGLETENGPMIGCQTSRNTKSAIMFRQSDQNKDEITVAALSFYGPVLDRFNN